MLEFYSRRLGLPIEGSLGGSPRVQLSHELGENVVAMAEAAQE